MPAQVTGHAVPARVRTPPAHWINVTPQPRPRLAATQTPGPAVPGPYGHGRGRPLAFDAGLPLDRPGSGVAPRALVDSFLSTDFDDNAVNNSGFVFIPPDSHAAAGTAHLVNVVNATIRFHQKDTTLDMDASLASFFFPLSPVNALFDPKVMYDQYEDRFVVVALELQDQGSGDPTNSSRILVAVSDDGDPNGSWFFTAIDGEETIGLTDTWADFPGVGLDEEAVYITANKFGFSDQLSGANQFQGVRLWVIDKGTTGGFYAGMTAEVSRFNPYGGCTVGLDCFELTTQPAHVFGTVPAGAGTIMTGYSGLTNGTDEFLQLVRIDDPLGSPVFVIEFINVGNLDDTSTAVPDAPQPDVADLIDTGDRRTLVAKWRSGALWTTFLVVPNPGAADAGQATAAWSDLDTTATSGGNVADFRDSGIIGGEGIATDTHTYFPAVAVDSTGKAVIGFSASAPTLHGSSYYTAHDIGDAAGATATPTLVRQGTDFYIRTFGGARNRWGDYSSVAVDPATDCFWVYNQHAMTRGTVINGEDGRWATAYAEECPPNDTGDAPSSYGMATHAVVNGLHLGAIAPDIEAPRFDTADASGDDSDGQDDEDGASLPDSATSDGVYTASLTVTNTRGTAAMLCGWFDFNQDGTFDNTPNTSTTAADPNAGAAVDTGERSCAQVADNSSGVNLDLVWTIAQAERDNSGTFNLRFRLTTDPAFFSPTSPSPTGAASDGEVEDHQVNIVTLPVSIAAFDSRFIGEGLYVEWGTVSETRNAGFHIWGETGDGFQRLNASMIPARTSDAVSPANYARVLDGIGKGEVTRVAITAVDTGGREKMYGLFEVGRAYGNKTQPVAIDWAAVRGATAQRLRARGFERAGEGWRRSAGSPRSAGGVVAVDVRPAAPGMQRVSYQDLAEAGLDLTGVGPGDIAVTLKGKGVARHIAGVDDDGGSGQRAGGAGAIAGSFGGGKGSDKGTGSASFGPGAFIDFWAEAPAYPDALYVGGYVYRIEIDSRQAVAAGQRTVAPKPSPDHYTEVVTVNDDNDYHFANVAEDPWYAARLRANASNDRHTASIHLDNAVRTDRAAELSVTVSGLTDFPAAPDHRVQVSLNGQVLETVDFDGRQVRELVTAVPAGLLQPGANSVEVLLPGGTGAAADIVLVDTVELRYPRALQAQNNRLSVDAVANTGGLTVTGFTDAEMLAYAFDGNRLWTLPVQTFSRGSVQVPSVAAAKARYWLSTVHRIQRPEVLGGVSEQDLLDEPANYLIIAHPSLMPPSAGADHPLNDYIAQREAEGWRVGLYDLAAIQVQYGHGMALPGAVTRFLEAAEQRFDYQHVLLVGDDSYDYRDHLGLGSVSFIPTRYTATTHIPHTPSDALLADLDGDGVGDKAIGRWPVRSDSDLEVVVQKTLDWQGATGGDQSALWVTDSEDARLPSFIDQAERMIDPLEQAGWPDSAIERVYFDQVEPGADQTRAEAARQAMVQAIESGKSLTGFVGHGAPSMWTFQGLLTPDDVSAIDNEGLPTLISTLTCYTSYFVSPHTDTLAHRLINGYREDAAGNPIPGVANGAVAIHGAATLSDYSGNETFARAVLEAQLEKGATLGAAIHSARQQAAGLGLDDVVRNWALLGDPTLVLEQAQK